MHFSVTGFFSIHTEYITTDSPPPNPDQVGIENSKQLFSQLLAFTTRKIATHCADTISARAVAFFLVVNASRREKSYLQFLMTSAVFQMLLRQSETHLVCLSCSAESATEALSLSLSHSIVFHVCFTSP